MKMGTALAPIRSFREMMTTDPWRTLEERMSRLFEPAFAGEAFALTTWTPSCDIYEADNHYVLKVELPGLKREDVKINIENNVLTIRGERKFEEETKRENFRRLERSYGEFMRSFTLPGEIDANHIKAEYKDGLLEVLLPKNERAKPKAIEVKVG